MFIDWLMEKIGWIRLSKYENLEYALSFAQGMLAKVAYDRNEFRDDLSRVRAELAYVHGTLKKTENKLATQCQLFRPWSDAKTWEVDAFPMGDDGCIHPDWEDSRGKRNVPQSIKLRRKKR